jgi:hypothetical protein
MDWIKKGGPQKLYLVPLIFICCKFSLKVLLPESVFFPNHVRMKPIGIRKVPGSATFARCQKCGRFRSILLMHPCLPTDTLVNSALLQGYFIFQSPSFSPCAGSNTSEAIG